MIGSEFAGEIGYLLRVNAVYSPQIWTSTTARRSHDFTSTRLEVGDSVGGS